VVDRAALADSSERVLQGEVVEGITHRLDGGADETESAADRKPSLSDAIAAAVAEHVSPRLAVARADARRRR
jgi:hypothetical protein